MVKKLLILLIFIGILISGCTQKPIEPPKSKEECESHGGRWHSWSFWQGGKKECDMPYPDGGKICDDSSDCRSGMCLYKTTTRYNSSLINQIAKGYCAYWFSTSCVNHHYFIKNGKIIEEICVE